jgi:hypothetical protein
VLIWIVWAAMLEAPSAAVTLNRTWWLAGVENVVVVTGRPPMNGPNGPLSATSQA